jgi:hypothetical protein
MAREASIMPRKKRLTLSTDPLSEEERGQLEPATRPEQKKSLLRHAVEGVGDSIIEWPTTFTFGLVPSLRSKKLSRERKERDLLDTRMRKEIQRVHKGAEF